MVKTESQEELLKRIEELELLWKRAHADYQNLDKRMQSDREACRIEVVRQMMSALLPVFETFRQASEHIDNEGLHLGFKQLQSTIDKLGIKKIETVGQAFNPHLMEAIDTVESEKEVVVSEAYPGYIYRGQVIMPAKVIVGKKKEEQENVQMPNAE